MFQTNWIWGRHDGTKVYPGVAMSYLCALRAQKYDMFTDFLKNEQEITTKSAKVIFLIFLRKIAHHPGTY